MTVSDIFATKLKTLREESGLSQSQLADALGVSRGSISFYENGERTPDISFLAVVKEYFHVQLDYLLGYTEKKYADKPIVDINNFTSLPQYAQSRIDGVKDRMAEVSQKYIPASGNDAHKLFDCIHRDVLSVIDAYDTLERSLSTDWSDQQPALEQFKTDLSRSSEIEVIRHLYEQDFKAKKPNIETFVRTDATPIDPPRKGRKKK